MTDSSSLTSQRPYALGASGLAAGALAIAIVMAIFTSGPFAPQPELGTSLGELAAETGKSALRDFLGLSQPDPVAQPWTIDRVLPLVAVALSVAAIVLAIASALRGERRALALCAGLLGGSAIVLHVFTTTVVMILCVLFVFAFVAGFMHLLGIDSLG